MEDQKTVYFVKVGNLFYAGGHNSVEGNQKVFTYHFVTEKELVLAVPLGYKDVAHGIAEKIGGEIIEKCIAVSNLKRLDMLREKHRRRAVEYRGKKLLPANFLI